MLLPLAFICGSNPVFAGFVYTANPENYRSQIDKLRPGDHLHLLPGEYIQGLLLQNLNGSAQEPIVISGPDSGPHAIFLARSEHNTISIVNSGYITIRNLELDGRDLPVDGVKCEGHADWAHHITLEGLRIRGHGNNQQTVGISTKCPAWNWVIRQNVIEGAGTGMYLGNSDGRAPFFAGLIERNLIVDTLGYNLQIKHQQPRLVLPDMPGERGATVIRHNVFSKAHGGSILMARPNVLVGHWPLRGAGANDQYFIYGNFFYQNPFESLFQGEGNIALYNNLFVNHFGDAVRIQPHNDTPRDISVFYNTVVAAGTGIYLARKEAGSRYLQWIEGNAIFAHAPLTGYAGEGNLARQYEAAREYLVGPFSPLGKMELAPLPGKLQSGLINAGRLHIYPEWNKDFDGRQRSGRELGAYAGSGVYHWTPKIEIKPLPFIAGDGIFGIGQPK